MWWFDACGGTNCGCEGADGGPRAPGRGATPVTLTDAAQSDASADGRSGSPGTTAWAADNSDASCVDTTATTTHPAARPAATPAGASSMTTHVLGSDPSFPAARR